MSDCSNIFAQDLETHKVTTEDGYILSLYKVKGKASPEIKGTVPIERGVDSVDDPAMDQVSTNARPQVLIVHGFLCSGLEWLINGPEKSLPYMLMAEGYDCWLASLRGSKTSKGHVSLSFKSKKFWDFSVHELGVYDVPAIIDYILETTKQQKLYIVAHSLGCSACVITMAMRPEYNSKVIAMSALCPAAYGKDCKLLILKFGSWGEALIGKRKFAYRRKMPIKTVHGYSKWLGLSSANSKKFCTSLSKFICTIGGSVTPESEQINSDGFNKLALTVPASTSSKVYAHIMQVYSSGILQAFDHGRSANLKKYGQSSPPKYEVNSVQIPVATFTSIHDKLIPCQGVAQVAEELPNLISHTEISTPIMSHADFMLGKDTDEVVYKPIIQIFNNFLNVSE